MVGVRSREEWKGEFRRLGRGTKGERMRNEERERNKGVLEERIRWEEEK